MKNSPVFFAILVLLLGFTTFYGCVGDGTGSDLKKGDSGAESIVKTPEESLPVTPGKPSGEDPVELEAGYTLLRVGPHGNFIAYHEEWVYARCYNGKELDTVSFYRMRPDGTEKQKILDESSFYQSVYHDGWLYYRSEISETLEGYDYDQFIEGAYGGALYRMRLDGSEKMQYAGVYGVSNYIIEGEWIYFQSGHDVYRIKINGSGLEKLVDNCVGFIIAEGYIFLRYGGTTGGAAQYDTKIMRCNLDGTGKTVLIEDEMISFKPEFADSGYLYYTLYFGEYYVTGTGDPWKGMELHRMKIDGTERQTLVQHSDYYLFRTIVLKDGYIYYSRLGRISLDSNDDTSYYRVRPDGTDHVLLCDKISNYHESFEIIGSNMYYYVAYSWDNSVLYRLSINGGSPEAVYTNTSEYYTGYFVANNKLYIVVR